MKSIHKTPASIGNVKSGSTKTSKLTKRLERETFRTNREMDFFSEKELITQTGHSRDEWPLVILKELIDNSLDACEEGNIAPSISVHADASGITVKDNGPGIPPSTVEAALDFRVRVSSREVYVAPDRGAQGNALKTLFPMPYVLDGEHGTMTVSARGVQHSIACRADVISQRPVIDHEQTQVPIIEGTEVRLNWSERRDDDGISLWPFGEECKPAIDSVEWWRDTLQQSTLSLLQGFALFNPHLTLDVHWFGSKVIYRASDPAWKKWKPDKPTSPHWYELQHLERLVAAHIAKDRDRGTDRTVADFIKQFDGLTGTQKRKAVIEQTGMSRFNLSALASDDGLNSSRVDELLTSMKQHTKPVNPKRLSVIGKDHLAARFSELGCDSEQFQYSKRFGVDEGLPYVLEAAFSWRADDADDKRQIFTGANWSSAIKNPFRAFGSTGEGLEASLTELKAGANEPIVYALHLAHPRIEYTDRGKSAIVIADGEERGEK